MTRPWLLIMLGLTLPWPAFALEPQRREVTVVSGRVWDGFEYRENFLPSTFGDLSLMSDKDSAITFVRTQEYYWPLSRQVYVDFQAERNELDGVLKVFKDGKAFAEIPKSKYAIIYPEGAINGGGRLVWGKDADAAYAAYQQGERDFERRYVEIQQANTLYERKLVESGAARLRGEKVDKIDPPPPLPEPSLRLVTQPVSGFQVKLAPGDYRIGLYAGGQLAAGTDKALHVIDVAGRRTLVADIVPEERWTRPLASNSDAARVFVRPGSVFYLTLADADRYEEAEYLPVITPQAEAVEGRNMWVRRKPASRETVALAWKGGAESTISIERLKVEQLEGSGFGYKVRPARAGEKEDLSAFMIAVPSDTETRGAVDVAGDRDLAFHRDIVVVQPRHGAAGFLLALSPVATWLAIAVTARRRRKSPPS